MRSPQASISFLKGVWVITRTRNDLDNRTRIWTSQSIHTTSKLKWPSMFSLQFRRKLQLIPQITALKKKKKKKSGLKKENHLKKPGRRKTRMTHSIQQLVASNHNRNIKPVAQSKTKQSRCYSFNLTVQTWAGLQHCEHLWALGTDLQVCAFNVCVYLPGFLAKFDICIYSSRKKH